MAAILLLGNAGIDATATAAPHFPAGDIRQALQPVDAGELPIDVVVVLDDSGSVATCWPWPQEGTPFTPPCRFPSVNEPTDPENLRYSAARLLVHLADEADRLAVIRFDSRVEGIGTLGSLQEAGSAERRRVLAASLQPPNEYLSRGYTRIDLGLEEAGQILRANRQPNRSQYILLLTDGEPTAPGNAPGIRGRISQEISRIQGEGVLIFPVVLCSPTSGCEGEFLGEEFGPDLREAQTGSDLVRVFSEIFSAMKADRSVVTSRDPLGNLSFTTRDAHDVSQLAFVSPSGAITGVQREGEDVATRELLADGNIDLNVLEGDLPAGRWVAQTRDPSAFAVVRAASYPALIFPPPSAANSPASVRYYPRGKQPLLIAQGNGPAAGEPLLINGRIPMTPLAGEPGRSSHVLANPGQQITLQLGEDRSPLQLQRTFRLESRDDLPRAQVFAPTSLLSGLQEDGRLQMQVGFGPGASVENIQARAYIYDVTQGEPGQPVYQADLSCGERTCTDGGFTPADGRSYRVRYLLSGRVEGVSFGDWAEARLDVEPAVYLRGLPQPLDLSQQPPEGWPVSIVAGTTEEIGTLDATLLLNRVEEDGSLTPAPEASLIFSEDVQLDGVTEALFRVQGLDLLRPGQYRGEVRLQAISPAGRAMTVRIRPGESLPVTLGVERSVARFQSQLADFGAIPFETSPNFRVDARVNLPVIFEPGGPFVVEADLVNSSCEGLILTSGAVTTQAGGHVLPLRVQSQGILLPGTCSGQIRLSGPNADFDVFPSSVGLRVEVQALQWSVTGDLDFGDLGLEGERATRNLLFRYDGPAPFVVEMVGFQAAGRTDQGRVEVSDLSVEMPPVEVNTPPNAQGFYEVPITLVARQPIPLDPLRGSLYSGDLRLGIRGLPGESRTVDVAFRSPSLYQRYVAWWLVPIYSLPALLCTGPFTLLMLLIFMARVRSRGLYEEDEEPMVTLPQPDLLPTRPAEDAFGTTSYGSSGDSADWGSGLWGDVNWGGSDSESSPNAGGSPSRRTPPDDDPWASQW
jgi:hypothetical protein